MSTESSNLAAQLLELERAALDLLTRVDRLDPRAAAAAIQGAAWWYAPIATPTAPTPANCTFSGLAAGCGGLGLPNAAVAIKATSSGATLWSGTADGSGAYSGAITLAASTAVTITVSPATGDPYVARFAASASGSATLVIGANTLPKVSVAPVSSYHCSGLVYFPLPGVLHLTSSVNGAFTLNWQTASTWTGGKLCPYPGCTPCAALASTSRSFQLGATTLSSQFGYVPSSGPCPSSAATATSPDVTVTMTATSLSPFMATGAVAAGNGSRWLCGVEDDWTLTE